MVTGFLQGLGQVRRCAFGELTHTEGLREGVGFGSPGNQQDAAQLLGLGERGQHVLGHGQHQAAPLRGVQHAGQAPLGWSKRLTGTMAHMIFLVALTGHPAAY